MEGKDKALMKYLAVGGALGLSYLLMHYLTGKKKSGGKSLGLERTTKLLQQIKYQILTTCFNYAEAVNTKLKGAPNSQDLEIVFRTELAKVYEAREAAVLNKYDISKEDYGVSLEKNKKDQNIKQGLGQIFDMMEKAVKGQYPNLAVPQQAQQIFNKQQLLDTYFEMCQLISIRLWKKLDDCKKENPGFNSRDETHYQKAVKDLSIFDLKTEFLKGKGFRVEWGSPNEVFYKIMEAKKQQDPDFKTKALKIQKAYQKVIQAVTTQTDTLTEERISFKLKQQGKGDSKPQNVQPVKPFTAPPVSKSLGAKPKKSEDDELQDLMMQQLLNRSAENPAESAPKVDEVKIEVPKEKESEVNQEQVNKEIPDEKVQLQVKEQSNQKLQDENNQDSFIQIPAREEEKTEQVEVSEVEKKEQETLIQKQQTGQEQEENKGEKNNTNEEEENIVKDQKDVAEESQKIEENNEKPIEEEEKEKEKEKEKEEEEEEEKHFGQVGAQQE